MRENFGLVQHNIPRELFPTSEQFSDPEKLLTWANEKELTFFLLQKSIQKLLIEVRGVFKGMKKDIDWSAEDGQEKVNAYQIKEVIRSKSKKSDEENAKDFLSDMTPAQLKSFLADIKKKQADK